MKQSLASESERQQKNRSHPIVSNTSPVSQAFVDNRASTALQRQLMAEIENSPQSISQRQLSDQIHNSPRMIAQRQQMAAISGGAVQRVEGEEELLQGKFKPIQRVEEEELLQGKFNVAQRVEEEELMQGKFVSIQRVEEEELLQGKFDTAQRVEEELLQGQFNTAQLAKASAEKQNNTGLPDNLKRGIENLSGMSLDNVKVHYNSSKPAQLNALAYAQGTDIHLGAGQEKHLPHEAWHVVQQAQGRVKPTMQMKNGVSVNDDQALEHEADIMGTKALILPQSTQLNSRETSKGIGSCTTQLEEDRTTPNLYSKNCSIPVDSSFAPVQRIGTQFTDALANATPAYLRELSTLHAPGLWDYTNAGAFAVTHKGRKNALGMSDANYSAAILKTTSRTNWLGLDTKHFSRIIDLSSPKLATELHGRDCANAAEYLMHYNRGEDLSLIDPTNSPAPLHATRNQVEESTGLSADYVPLTQRPAVLPANVPGGVKDANAQADIGEAYCIVSEPNSGKYNFHYGAVAAKKGAEVLTVEGFATSSALTTPDWSFNVYDSASTFHQVWQQGMTKSTPPFAPGYPFTFVTKLV